MKLKLYHKIDAKHARNIGEESVSNAVQAVIELVKNSRDADATACIIRFVGHKTEDGSIIYDTIVFDDNGIGMTVEDLQNRYFRIATAHKERETISPVFKRRVVGSKGMGHFSAQRLGEVCKIISNPWKYKGREHSDSVDKKIVVDVDWRKFEAGMEFGAIPSECEVTERPPGREQGLNLELSELKDEWTEDKIEDLKQALSILQTPKALQSVSDPFGIQIQADGLDLKPEPLPTDILDNAQYKLDCKFKGGKRYWNIYSRKKANIGKWEKVKSSMVGGEIASVDASLGDAHFELYHFSLESDFYNKPIQKKAVTDF